jgi:hypothetical protein
MTSQGMEVSMAIRSGGSDGKPSLVRDTAGAEDISKSGQQKEPAPQDSLEPPPSSSGLPAGDTFKMQSKSAASSLVGAGSPLLPQTKMEKATLLFSTRLQKTLNHDALSLAQGKTPWKTGDTLSGEQRDAMEGAAKDFVMDIPIGMMAPRAAKKIDNGLRSQGISVENLNHQSLRELSKEVPDLARTYAQDLVKGFKEKSPGGYYGMMAAGIAGAGAIAYTKGTKPLEKFGIKPKFSTDLFNDRVHVKAEASWKAHFSDFNLKSTVSGKVPLKEGAALHLSATTQFAEGSLQRGELKTRLSLRDGLQLSGSVGVQADGISDARLSSQLTLGRGSILQSELGFDPSGLRHVGAAYSLKHPSGGLELRSHLNYDIQEDRTTAKLSAVKRFQGMESALFLSHDTAGNSHVGVGLNWRF